MILIHLVESLQRLLYRPMDFPICQSYPNDAADCSSRFYFVPIGQVWVCLKPLDELITVLQKNQADAATFLGEQIEVEGVEEGVNHQGEGFNRICRGLEMNWSSTLCMWKNGGVLQCGLRCSALHKRRRHSARVGRALQQEPNKEPLCDRILY